MNERFYNGKYTLIVNDTPTYYVPDNIEVLVGTLQSSYSKILDKQLNKDTFYNGHIINLHNTLIDIPDILKNSLTRSNIFFKSVTHYPNENVDPSLIFCSSWVLPFICDTELNGKELYSKCYVHRLDILELKTII